MIERPTPTAVRRAARGRRRASSSPTIPRPRAAAVGQRQRRHLQRRCRFAGPQLSTVAQTVRTQDFFWALGVERDRVGAPRSTRAYDTLARSFHADRYRNSPDDDRRLAQEIFERLAEAHRVLRDPARRRAYVAKLERGRRTGRGEPAARAPRRRPRRRRARPATAGPVARPRAPVRERASSTCAARRHHEAVEALRQAARLVPNEADFRAALGWALFREAPADARAGRAALAELRRAVQIDARNRRRPALPGADLRADRPTRAGHPGAGTSLAIDPTATDVADELRRLRDNG